MQTTTFTYMPEDQFIPRVKRAFLYHVDNPEAPILMESQLAGTGEYVTERHSDYWLCYALWDCPDILPAQCCHKLGLPTGSTFGQAARQVKPKAQEYWEEWGDAAPLYHISDIRPAYTGN